MEKFDSKVLNEKKVLRQAEARIIVMELEILINVYGDYLPEHKLEELKSRLAKYHMRDQDVDDELEKPV